MKLGIDASNIRTGGGLRHLVELISHANIAESGFNEAIIWASQKTLDQLPDREWLIKHTHPFLNQSLILRVIWQKFYLSREAERLCDILFLPSGNTSSFHPYVSMCQNLLPFEPEEKKRYGLSLTRLRLELLKKNQCNSFRKSDGTIFLSEYSLNQVENICGTIKSVEIIPHGAPSDCGIGKRTNQNTPIQLLYVSTIDMYKHQWNVVQALHQLLDGGYKVDLTLIGSSYGPALKKLMYAIEERPEYKSKIKVLGGIPHSELKTYYQKADVFVFASSCETFGMIVLEAMANGLPLVCSKKSSMKEIVQDAGTYFNPEQPNDIALAIKRLLDNKMLVKEMSEASLKKSSHYSWNSTAVATFQYLNSFVNKE